jgi:hypothetical protein
MSRQVCTVMGTADPGTATEDNTMFFNTAQLEAVVAEGQMKRLPVWLEHGDATKEQIGEVVYAWVDESGMHVLIALDLQLVRSRVVMQWISSGIFQGLSLGYTATLDKAFNVTHKRIHELSIVRRPYHKSCKIFYTGLLPSDLLKRVAPGHKPKNTCALDAFACDEQATQVSTLDVPCTDTAKYTIPAEMSGVLSTYMQG